VPYVVALATKQVTTLSTTLSQFHIGHFACKGWVSDTAGSLGSLKATEAWGLC